MNGTAFAAFTRPPVIHKCIVCDILAALDPEVSERAKDALAAGKKVWPHTSIADTFAELGHPCSPDVIGTHRKRCS